MSMPFYVSPEQLMKDRADYARKGIARGRSVVVLGYAGGIAFVAENPSTLMHKVSEIYDRIAFAAVGKYTEFESLRVAGVRYADMRGYAYDRADVTARGLANVYAQTLGNFFTTENKPLEVELVVAEVGLDQNHDQLYRLTYDGSVADEQGFVVMGGTPGPIMTALRNDYAAGMTLSEALTLAVGALTTPAGSSSSASGDSSQRSLSPKDLEIAVLDRARPRRTFRRLGNTLVGRLLDAEDALADVPAEDDTGPGPSDTLSGEQS